MGKPKRKLTNAEKAPKRKRRKETMIVFMHSLRGEAQVGAANRRAGVKPLPIGQPVASRRKKREPVVRVLEKRS